MKKTERIWLLLFGVAMLATFSVSSAWAIDCGDANGPAHPIDVPCACGDTVVSDTVLDSSDPVLKGGCFPVGLFVNDNVKLDAHSLNPKGGLCLDDHPFPPAPGGIITIGFFIGNNVEIDRGIIRGCDYGIFGFTSGSQIERVTAGRGRLSVFLIGDDNTLSHNQCDDNTHFGGIFVAGDFNTIARNYCRGNRFGDGIAVNGDLNTLSHNLCHENGDPMNRHRGIFVLGDFNSLERNFCQGNGGDGIAVEGNFNYLATNRGQSNGAHGIFAPAPTNTTDFRNYATGNDLDPQCVIDNSSGTYC